MFAIASFSCFSVTYVLKKAMISDRMLYGIFGRAGINPALTFEKRETLKKENYAKTWLIRILINECYSLLRRQKKYVTMETTEIPERKQPEKTDYSELYQAVSELKEELKLPVILYYAEDFSIKEIAEILEITEGAVQKRLARARGKLKKAFEHKEVFV